MSLLALLEMKLALPQIKVIYYPIMHLKDVALHCGWIEK